jgi:hypothetical protein
MLKAYDDYKPGMGTELLDYVKGQTHHRQEREAQQTGGSEIRLNAALSNAFKIAIFGVIAAGVIAIFNTWVAVVVALVTVGGPSGATIAARVLDRIPAPKLDK